MTNPLLNLDAVDHYAPDFPKIKAEHFVPAIEVGLKLARERVREITENSDSADFENTIEAIEYLSEEAEDASSILGTLYNVQMTPDMEAARQEVQILMNNFSKELFSDKALFERVESVYNKKETLDLEEYQELLLDDTYKAFVRNGAKLDKEGRRRLKEIDEKMIMLSNTFMNNNTKAVNNYAHFIKNEARLEGISDHVVAAMKSLATEKGEEDKWCASLQPAMVVDILTYAKDRKLRHTIWRDYQDLASDGDVNNYPLIKEILQLRSERSELLGYQSFPHFALEKRIVNKPEKLTAFLKRVRKQVEPFYERDYETLADFAKERDGLEDFKPWDLAFYKNEHESATLDYNPQEVQNYLPLDKVLTGFFDHCETLFNINFKQTSDIPVYHDDVTVYEVYDNTTDDLLGIMYADFYYRDQKYPHAWMSPIYTVHDRRNGKRQLPICSINASNIKSSDKSKPSLISLSEVRTLFHEGGHALHVLLSQSPKYRSQSGTNVKWDFVELPSQIQENWARQKSVLQTFAKHYETGEVLPDELFEKIEESHLHMQSIRYYRQCFLGALDAAWHMEVDGNESLDEIKEFETKVAKRFYPDDQREGGAISQRFTHIFSGGYACGYYSYAYCEMLDADAFAAFEETGDLYHPETAAKFRQLMDMGGSRDPLELYRDFRGKDPDPEAMFQRVGLVNNHEKAA